MQAQESTSRVDDRATNFSPAVRSASSASPLSSPGPSEEEDDEKEMALDEQEIEADDEGVSGEQKASARGPNTSVNYKIKFQKARERYNRIQAVSSLHGTTGSRVELQADRLVSRSFTLILRTGLCIAPQGSAGRSKEGEKAGRGDQLALGHTRLAQT
jgi:hypothetical protein